MSERAPDTVAATEPTTTTIAPENLRAVRLGHGANCSSVGSVIDMLFVSAAVGGAVLAAVCAALAAEKDDPKIVAQEDDE